MVKLVGYVMVDSGAMGISDLGIGDVQVAFSTDVGDGIYPVYVDRSGEYPKVVIDLDPMAHHTTEFDEYLDDLALVEEDD